jgi:HEAT repeat protein
MLLLNTSSSDELTNRLQKMTPARIRKQAEEVKPLLAHRSQLVRWAAAEALGRAGLGADELRERLGTERNELVLTEIAESLASLKDEASLPRLRSLAEEHSSALVRNYALLAIADISSKEALPYLRDRLVRERSRRVKAFLRCALFAKGAGEVLPDLLKDLRSNDPRVRRGVANLLYHYAPRRQRPVLLAALREAAGRETHPGALGLLERAIEELS